MTHPMSLLTAVNESSIHKYHRSSFKAAYCQSMDFFPTLREFSEVNKSLGTWKLNRLFGTKSADLKILTLNMRNMS